MPTHTPLSLFSSQFSLSLRSAMKDLFSVSRRRKHKLKLVCSFNGTFQPRPPSGKLRYAGGETRILSVDRNIGFSRLKSKVLELFPCPNGIRSFSLVYHLPDAKSADGDAPLVLITCDDDVWCMIQEYEKLELSGTHPRLWVFVCHDNAFGNVIDKSCVDFGRNLKACLGGSDDNNSKVKKHVVHRSGVRASDDSLRKILLKQQLLAKQSVKPGGLSQPVDCRLGLEDTEVECDSGKIDGDNHGRNLTSEPESPMNNETRNPVYVMDSHRMNTLDGENCGSRGHFPVSHFQPLNPTDFNVRVKSGIPLDSLSRQSYLLSGGGQIVSGGCGQFGEAVQLLKSPNDLSMNMVNYMNRENIVPRDLKCNTVQTAFAPLDTSSHFNGNVCPQKSLYSGFLGGIRNQFGLGETRNSRACPHHVKNHRYTEMGNHGSIRMDGRPWMGKSQHALQLSSNIAKQGQLTKAYYPSSLKPSSDSCLVEVEGLGSATDHGLNKHTCLFNVPCHDMGNLAYEDPNNKESSLGLGMLNEQIDDVISPVHELHELPQSTVLETPTNVGDCDIKVEAGLTHQHEHVSMSGAQNNPGPGNELGLRCDDKLLGIEKAGSDSSLLALSLHSLSLSLFKEMDPTSPSLTAARDVAEALLKPQSKFFDLMDEEHFSSGPQAEKSSEATSISSIHKPENDDDEKPNTKLEWESNLSISEKESLKHLKINDGVPADLAAFYTHVATRELQTINNSDLEYIKELGSGTYGTVFYGKWKGSDVAIKKIKPSCFTEGAVEKDRLVADFWKEAHILGQLRHPNIVALYGVVTDGPVTNLATVTEYMVNGSLKQVFRRKDRTIDRRKRLIIAMDAAFGMEYLHGKNIVHFDLKSHNFLVNMRDPQRPVCKIGDLGLSKIKQKTLVSGGVRGTIPWMAPELLNTESMVTEKVDVYSFGIVMWELLTGEEPYAKTRSEDMIGGIIRGTLRPEIPSWCDPVWRSLMERCWSSNPDVRPDFSEIAKELRTMAAAMNIK